VLAVCSLNKAPLIEWKLVLVQMLAGSGGVAVGNKAKGVDGVGDVSAVWNADRPTAIALYPHRHKCR